MLMFLTNDPTKRRDGMAYRLCGQCCVSEHLEVQKCISGVDAA